MRKRGVCVLLAVLLITGAAPPAGANTAAFVFDDVAEGDWFYEDVDWADRKGVAAGTGFRLWSPEAEMTRAMYITLLGRVADRLGADTAAWAEAPLPFGDVDERAYYTPYVRWAYGAGLVDGTSETTFSPDESITREQLAVMLVNLGGYLGFTPSPLIRYVGVEFDLEDASDWARAALSLCLKSGVMTGYDDGGIRPRQTATRAEAMRLLRRYLEACGVELEDVPDHLTGELDGMLSGLDNGTWSVCIYRFSDGYFYQYGTESQPAASLIKLFIMGAVYEAIEQGRLAESDSLNRLLHEMITVSSNEAANTLTARLGGGDPYAGMDIVNAFIRERGFTDTVMGRTFGTAYRSDNYTTTADCVRFFNLLYGGRLVSPSADQAMLSLLRQQQRTWKIPAGLPDGVASANKTGELSTAEHDAAIVFAPGGDYLICVMSTDLRSTAAARASIVALSALVYSHMEA